MRTKTITLVLCVLCVFGIFSADSMPCSAQPLGKTVLVAHGVGDLRAAITALPQLESQLSARRVPIISMHDARDRLHARSRAPQAPSASDLDTLAKEAQQAVRHVAFGRSAAAEKSVREIVALAERSLESFNRETATARQLLDACLALVRASAHDGKRDLAIEQAMHCRRLVPDLSPNESSHPANVIGVLAEADDQLRRMRVGSLRVHTQPESGCAVYLNGRHLGTTPFALDRASVGEYRVQAECDESKPGRVHIVELGDEPVELTIDTGFDAAIVTEPRLALRYASEAAVHAELVEHAIQLGRAVRAEEVLLLSVGAGEAELLRVQVRHERLVGGVALARTAKVEFEADSLALALDALAQGRFVRVAAAAYRARTTSEGQVGAPAPTGVAPYTVTTKPADARLLLDGAVTQRGKGDVLPLSLGTHLLEVRAEGYRSAARDLRVSDSSPRRLDIALLPLVESPAREAVPLRKKWWLWTTLGVVVAGGVTAGLLLGLRDRGGETPETTIDIPENMRM
jgi:hypothetical protein